ncbi:sugar phosphate isomerase/epimerase family protein [Leifsonia sp. NPDC058194]|uniref:sugar phosphate isomerase/epimerase family protein n=1 Tax=Leifsonia sp. NPDC058194 TaxID=3346374 RepID=UPI0036DA3F71
MIGTGSYAYFWRWSSRVDEPWSLAAQLADTAELGGGVFQICDYPPLLGMDEAALREVRRVADDLGIRLELGTKGVEREHLVRFLRLADTLGASLVRSMLFAPESRPTLAEAETELRAALDAYETAGVTLALETYEQIPSAALVALAETIGSDRLGICLDPANSVAALELPADVVERCAPYTASIHVKDFAFTRRDGWVGFTLEGARFGDGLLDYDQLDRAVRPDERSITRIVEHWLPWQGDPETTIRREDDWTRATLAGLKERA